MTKPVFAGVLGGMAQDLGWAEQANCRNMDINLFFPPVGQNTSPFVKEVCASCDVFDRCLWYANETSTDHGIFAGMSPKQRQDWRTKNGVTMGMSAEAWLKSRQKNLLTTPPTDWNDNDDSV